MFSWFRRRPRPAPEPAFAAAPPKAVKPEMNEIATTGDGRDITRGYLTDDMRLPSQDSILENLGGGRYDLYRQVLSDWQVQSVLQQRRQALVSCEWTVSPGGDRRQDKNAAAYLDEMLKHVGFDDATAGMHYGVFYGFAVAECLYALDGSTVALDAIRVRDRRRFAYVPSGELRLLTMTNTLVGEVLPERKFWAFATGADHDDEPYGMGLAHWLYWPVTFKRGNIKFWLIAAEKFGAPTSVGYFPPGTAKADQDRLLSALRALQIDAGAIFPDGMKIELLESSKTSGIDYSTLCGYMDGAIAKVTLGQVMTSEAAGGQYKADVQNQVKTELVKADADLICESLNRGPVRWLIDWNFPGAAYPRVFRQTEPDEDLNGRADRQRKLFDVGYRPTLQDVSDAYGGDWEPVPSASPAPDPTTPDAASPSSPAPAFAAAPDPAAPENDPTAPMVERLGAEADPLIEALMAPIRALLAESADLVEFRDKLLALYPQLDGAPLAALMGQALAVADAAGRLEVTK